jgi:hypothetical protein
VTLIAFEVMRGNQLLRHLLIPLILLSSGCKWKSAWKSTKENLENADALAKVIQILQAEKVTLLMYEDWCKVIKDDRGMFFKSSNVKYPFTGEASPFDATASNDFDRIWKQISAYCLLST